MSKVVTEKGVQGGVRGVKGVWGGGDALLYLSVCFMSLTCVEEIELIFSNR